MIRTYNWAGTIFTVDSDELAAWMKEHPSTLAGQPISTKIDNYGLGGNKAAARKVNGFAVQKRIDEATR